MDILVLISPFVAVLSCILMYFHFINKELNSKVKDQIDLNTFKLQIEQFNKNILDLDDKLTNISTKVEELYTRVNSLIIQVEILETKFNQKER